MTIAVCRMLDAASAGLEDIVQGGQQTSLLYSYHELGYMSTVDCRRNGTSAWGVSFTAAEHGTPFPMDTLPVGFCQTVRMNQRWTPRTLD
jgi:hypothetical protein